jgi:hypothetical protein
LAEQLRQAALDLAMSEVGEIVEFSRADCDSTPPPMNGSAGFSFRPAAWFPLAIRIPEKYEQSLATLLSAIPGRQ